MDDTGMTTRQRLEAAYHARCYAYFYDAVQRDERLDHYRAYDGEGFEQLCQMLFDTQFAIRYMIEASTPVDEAIAEAIADQAQRLGMGSEGLQRLEEAAAFALRRNPADEKQRRACHAAVPHSDAARQFTQKGRIIQRFDRTVADLTLAAETLTAAEASYQKHPELEGKLNRKLGTIRRELEANQQLHTFCASRQLAVPKVQQAVYESLLIERDAPLYDALPPTGEAMMQAAERRGILDQLRQASVYEAAVSLELLEYYIREARNQLKVTMAEHYSPFVARSPNVAIVHDWQQRLAPLNAQVNSMADDLLQGDGTRERFSENLKLVADGMRIATSSYVTRDTGRKR